MMLRRGCGAILLVLGVAQMLWFLYNTLFNRQPEIGGFEPVIAIVVAVAFIAIGLRLLRRWQA